MRSYYKKGINIFLKIMNTRNTPVGSIKYFIKLILKYEESRKIIGIGIINIK